jgi:peptidoglycan/LPS O-acetylase OafA/YrhL
MTDPLYPVLDYPWLPLAGTIVSASIVLATILWATIERHVQAVSTRRLSRRDRHDRPGRDRL